MKNNIWIATRAKGKPLKVSFYDKNGKPIAFTKKPKKKPIKIQFYGSLKRPARLSKPGGIRAGEH